LFNSLCEMENYFESASCMEAEAVNLQIDKVQLNPNSDEILVQFQLEGETYLKIRLVDVKGRLVKQQYLSNINAGNHQLTWSVNGLNPGIYYTIMNTKLEILSQSTLIF